MKTTFKKEDFTWDGMYLMYRGDHGLSRTMDSVHPDCHPSWVGKPKPEFIARFKYGNYKPYKAWINFLVKSCTVETYVHMSRNLDMSPVEIMRHLGYGGKV